MPWKYAADPVAPKKRSWVLPIVLMLVVIAVALLRIQREFAHHWGPDAPPTAAGPAH